MRATLLLLLLVGLATCAPIVPRKPGPRPDYSKLKRPTQAELDAMFSDARLARLIRAKMSNWTDVADGASVCQLADFYGGALGNCGCPYQYGGDNCQCCNSPTPTGSGTDCSGLVWCAFNAAGWSGIGRDTYSQVAQTTVPPGCSPGNTAACGPADVFFYCFSEPCPDHVVMVTGGGYCAECPHTGEYCHIIECYSDAFQQAGRFPVC